VTPTEPGSEVTVRLGTVEDAPALADLYFARQLADDGITVWVAESGAEPLGLAMCTPTFLDGLYVRPDVTGQGIGSLLLDVVEATHPEGFELWVFESNTGAQRLYERRGLVVVEHTDGAGNEEKAPDLRMAWRP
jgi:GNAT superfamily N-acetyltransferase